MTNPHDPFEEVTSLDPMDNQGAFINYLRRSIMWDIIGPNKMKDEAEKFGQNPASMDVLEAEYKEMMARKIAILPINKELALMSYIAAECASYALLADNESYAEIFADDADGFKFRVHNVQLTAAVTEAIVGQLFHGGFIHYGAHP